MPQRLVKLVNAGISAGTASMICGDTQDNVFAAGTTQATATAIYGDNVTVINTAASTGVVLTGAQFSAGDSMMIANLGANALLVYPPVGSVINALSANAGFSVAAGKVARIYVRADATKLIAGVSA